MISHGKDLKIFSGNSNRALAEAICKELRLPLGDLECGHFSDGECFVSIYETVRGSDVFVIQSTCSPVNDSLMELLERSSRLNEGLLRRYSRRAGPALGGLLGIVPQCGISGAAATLFSTGSITVGTMLAVFFATSDEMLPIFLSSLTESSGISWKTIVLITLSKAALGILLGYLADLLFGRWFRAQKSIHSFCEREHCDCDEEEGSVFLAALRHTLKIAAMLIAVNFALNLLFHYIGVERLSGTVLNRPVLGELILALFGLIPNCSVSVVVTESYLSGVLGLGGLFAGLLSNAGIGLLVLLRTNRNWKENAAVVAILYGFSVLAGIAVTLLAG
mgnify:CR=1 FL=1